MEPSATPAPTSAWSSSTKRITLLGADDLVENLLQPLLEVAAIFGADGQQADVERDDALVAQGVGHLAVDDALGQPLGDGRLADAGVADEDGIVLGAAREHLHGALNLLLAAHDGIELIGEGGGGEVAADGVEGGRHGIARLVLDAEGFGEAPLTPRAGDHRLDALERDAEALQDAGGDALALAEQAEQQVVGAHLDDAVRLGLLFGEVERLPRGSAEDGSAEARPAAGGCPCR